MKRIAFLLFGFFLLMSVPAFAQRFRIFPQFAAGGGWSCDMFVSNQGSTQATGIVISFYSGSGTPLTVVSNLGTAASFTVNLNAGETQILRFPATASLQTGYAVIRMPVDAAIIATEVFRLGDANTVLAELGVSQQMTYPYFTFPVEMSSSRRVSTGVAFANLTFDSFLPIDQTLVVNLINSNGTLYQTKLLPLLAGAHFSGYLDNPALFPGLDEFTGLLSVAGISPLGVLALRQDMNAFGSLAVDDGPVIAPFTLSGLAPVPETEPNNAIGQAQALGGNTQITGSIGSAGDLDYFSFAGRAGDIVTAIVDTRGLNSSLDSVLRLEKANGTLIIQNDQNGLLGQNDSFIQAALPADGTYYLRVSEYVNAGGSQYTYRLHARLTTGSSPPPNQPQISTINPSSGIQGNTVNITIQGTNLNGATAINFTSSTGLTISNMQATATQVTAQVTIASDAPTGGRQVTVTTPSGTSNALTFTINQGGGGGYDGNWSGTLSDGKAISLTVSAGKVTRLSFSFRIVASCCNTEGDMNTTTSQTITGNTFSFNGGGSGPSSVSFTISGTFTSGTQASGNLQLTLHAPVFPGPSCCAGTVNVGWNLAKN
jgi:hypothetical protein